MMRSELAFLPNNLSSYSLQMNNFIEEEANEDNSEPKSQPSSIKQQKQSQKNKSKDQSLIHNQSNSSHSRKLENQIQGLESQLQQKNSVLDTPVNLFNRPIGKYEFTPQAFPSDQQMLVEAITTQLNHIEKSDNKVFVSQLQIRKKQADHAKKQEKARQYEEIKLINPMEQVETDYSDLSRDVKIFQHRYQSNLSVLSDQTKELLDYYEMMIQQQEQKELRKQIMMLQIHNHRTKISLRNASYTKRFNYISPIPKNNDKPLEFKGKFQVKRQLVDCLEDLCQRIQDEQAVWDEQQARLTLLTKYYNIIKSRKIANHIQNCHDFHYDSKLERYTNRQQSIKNSQIAIDVPFTTANGFDITPTSSFSGTNNFIKKSPIIKKGLAQPQKNKSPKKKVEAEIIEPYQKYNLLKYKTQISKEMMLQYQVYNLGRLKRIKDQNRMIKKELEFIDEHIEHFDRSFAEQLKKYEQISKPKITYESFKIIQQETPFTKSPFGQDYYGNSKGCNTINLYRPDSKDPKFLKPISKSRDNINKSNKSLSQSKYTIKREPTINLSNSKKDLTLSNNFLLTQNDAKSEKSDTVVSFFRNRVASPQKSERGQHCIYTSNKQLVSIKQAPLNSSKKKLLLANSQRSLSPRSKNLVRFNSPQTLQSIGRKQIKSPRGQIGKRPKIQSKAISSEYCLSLDGQSSNK